MPLSINLPGNIGPLLAYFHSTIANKFVITSTSSVKETHKHLNLWTSEHRAFQPFALIALISNIQPEDVEELLSKINTNIIDTTSPKIILDSIIKTCTMLVATSNVMIHICAKLA